MLLIYVENKFFYTFTEPFNGLQDYQKLHYDIKKPFHHVPVSKQVIMQKKIYYWLHNSQTF